LRKIFVFISLWCFAPPVNTQSDSTEVKHSLDSLVANGENYSELVDSLWANYAQDHKLIYNYRVNIDSVEILSDLPDSVYQKRFEELDNLSPFDISYNPAVEKYINEYLRYSSHLKKVMGLAEYYFPMMEAELDAHDIPLEMKYLSVIESALNPQAKSPVGASGLWQFMLPTGRECGLTINSYVDERNDPVASTKAACHYLNKLYDIYGVWELAISAYNCGPGNVNKAIRSAGGSNNYWEIRPFLPRETQKYVPRFMCMVYIMTYGEEHNITPIAPDFSYWKVDTVKVHDQMRFDQIYTQTSITAEDLQILNPQFSKNLIPKSSRGTALVLPLSKVNEFIDSKEKIRLYKPDTKAVYLANISEKPRSRTKSANRNKISYKVRSGDVLGKIAENHGVSVSQIKAWNGIRGTRIKSGQTLVIYQPENKKTTKVVATTVSNEQELLADNTYSYYIVRRGDTLWDIAKNYPGISADQIKRWNTHVNPKNLKAGSKLKIYQS